MNEYHNMDHEPDNNNIPMNRYNSNIQSGANHNLSIPNTANYYIPIPYSDQENRATPSIYINQSQNIVNITNASHLNNDNQIPSMHHVSLTLFPKSIYFRFLRTQFTSMKLKNVFSFLTLHAYYNS